MYLVYCADSTVAQAIRTGIPSRLPLRIVSGWPEFMRVAANAILLVVHVPERKVGQFGSRLRQLRALYHLKPLVLLTARDPDLLRQLVTLNVGVAELVWANDSGADVWAALRRARGRGFRSRIAALIEQADISPLSLREALAAAVRNPEPPRRVSDLAALAHCDRTTLWKYWRAAFGAECTILPSHFVNWTLLVHAVARKRADRTWGTVADALGIHEHTLSRIAKRCTGTQLRKLEHGRAAFARRFDRSVLQQLLARGNISSATGNDPRLGSRHPALASDARRDSCVADSHTEVPYAEHPRSPALRDRRV